MAEYPFTNKPADIPRLFQMLPSIEVPDTQINADYIKSLGFSAGSSSSLIGILKALEFINDNDEPAENWARYASDAQRGRVLASAIRKTYAGLFEHTFCPYLEDDEGLMDVIKQDVKASGKEMALMLETFRNLSDLADYQDILCEPSFSEEPAAEAEALPEVKVNPNLQLNIQIHIDPATPDEKIETIFKNMRKYLIEKQGGSRD